MSRTPSARDLRPRRTRSDLGKKRKLYRGKKPKGRKRIKFEKRKGQKTHIKLWWWERRKMSIEGWRNWNPEVRNKIKPIITKFGVVTLTPVADISNKADIEEWAREVIGFPGHFIIMGISATFRNKHRRKWIKMFEIDIKDSAEGLRVKMTRNHRLFRYKWFWKG